MCPISSGNWNNGSNAGVWTLNLNNVRSNSNNNVGFRSDSDPPRIQQWNGGAKGGSFRQLLTAKSDFMRFSGRANCFEGQVS